MRHTDLFKCAIVLFGLTAGAARATTLDFEKRADGVTTPSNLLSASNEYSAQGVTFNGGSTAGQPVFRSFSTLSSSIATLPAGNDWFITTLDRTGGGAFFNLDAIFSGSIHHTKGDVVVNPHDSVTVTAFDALNNVLASTVIPSGSSSWISGSFDFSTADAIARISLVPDSSAAAAGLDNLVFDVAVPEAQTWLLMCLGLGLLGTVHLRRREHSR